MTKAEKQPAGGKESKGRNQINIDLDIDSVAQLNAYVKTKGGRGIRKALLSNLVRWWVKLPAPLRSAVAGLTDAEVSHVYADLHRREAELLDPASKLPASPIKGEIGIIEVPAPTYRDLLVLAKNRNENWGVREYLIDHATQRGHKERRELSQQGRSPARGEGAPSHSNHE